MKFPPSNREQKANKGSVPLRASLPMSSERNISPAIWRRGGRADSLLMIIKFCCFGAIRSVCFAFLSLSSGGKILVKQAKTMKTKRKEKKLKKSKFVERRRRWRSRRRRKKPQRDQQMMTMVPASASFEKITIMMMIRRAER